MIGGHDGGPVPGAALDATHLTDPGLYSAVPSGQTRRPRSSLLPAILQIRCLLRVPCGTSVNGVGSTVGIGFGGEITDAIDHCCLSGLAEWHERHAELNKILVSFVGIVYGPVCVVFVLIDHYGVPNPWNYLSCLATFLVSAFLAFPFVMRRFNNDVK